MGRYYGCGTCASGRAEVSDLRMALRARRWGDSRGFGRRDVPLSRREWGRAAAVGRSALRARSTQAGRRRTRTALFPPKAKEFLTATSRSALRPESGTKSSAGRSGSASTRFAVGGTLPWARARTVATVSRAPDAPMAWPWTAFVELDEEAPGVGAEEVGDRPRLGRVVEGARAVGVDVADRLGRQTPHRRGPGPCTPSRPPGRGG